MMDEDHSGISGYSREKAVVFLVFFMTDEHVLTLLLSLELTSWSNKKKSLL